MTDRLDAARGMLSLPLRSGLCFPFGSVEEALKAPSPGRAECEGLWDNYAMPPHIRAHSTQVARVTLTLAELLVQRGVSLSIPALLAAALLHDIAKIYTVNYPGDHAQIGAAIAVRETHNYMIGQMIYHHVGWPWKVDMQNVYLLHILLLDYADKRVKHDKIVTLEERFTDLRQRYGRSERSLNAIAFSHRQGQEIEKALSECLEVSINEYPFDSGRLVP
jgi:putative nucleotidyltransferase with HDIG domain